MVSQYLYEKDKNKPETLLDIYSTVKAADVATHSDR